MNATTVKWLVAGVVALVFLVIFKSEIGGLISRTNVIEVKGIKILATPIGQTMVSAQKAPEAQYSDPTKVGLNTHVDRYYKFAISWPENSDWVPVDKMSRSEVADLHFDESTYTFFVSKNETSPYPYGATVNVKALPREFATIQEAVDSYVQSQLSIGNAILSSEIDPVTGGAVLVTSSKNRKGVNRILLGETYMYLITMIAIASYPEEPPSRKLWEETNAIFNSFRILN